MKRIATGVVIGVLGLLLLTSDVAWAQATAELAGRVTDESGAVLPGVTVTATQTDTGFARTAVTDGTGGWVMPNLPTGPYRLEVALQGFRTYQQTGIVLQVGATPTINAVLGVGNLEETVSVEAAAPIVDVRSAGISEVVEQERIVELPLQGRQVTDLIVLAGAAVETGRPNSRSFQGGVNIAVAGGLSFGVAYLLDGAMHNDVQNAGGLPLPFPDALQEFRVATSALTAQAGMHSGASVNAVTKSGTNVLHGNAFEFLRDHGFNATSVFAAVGTDGKRVSDGLRRHQYGGTLGGPIVRDRLFFFGAYQGTPTRVTPTDNLAYVPTAAMLAGDFTAFTSPACNNGRQITLRAPYANNRIAPAQFSPAAVNLAKRLPQTSDPCGEVRFGRLADRDEGQAVGRVDYQRTANHSVFGRYMYTFDKRPAPLTKSDNVLTTTTSAVDNFAQSLTVGDTRVFGANMVNSLRFAFNQTVVDRFNPDFFEPRDLGINLYNYSPTKEMVIQVGGGFNISASTATRGIADNKTFQVTEDLTLVRGRHQIALGATVAVWNSLQRSWAQGGGSWNFNGSITGLGLADFLVGRVAVVEHGGRSGITLDQVYQALYVQDSWRATDRVTVNGGIRWEPFFGQQISDGSIANFSLDNFREGVRSAVFRRAPVGLLYPGDSGFPDGKSGFEKQWWNFSPRVGVAWDVTGDGRMALRSSYGINYDFPVGETWFRLAAGPPYGNRTRLQDPPGRMDDPYQHLGGDPHPIETGPDIEYPPFGAIGAVTPDINSPRIQSWNVTLERQLGTQWGASVSYLGSYSDRLWGLVAYNPGVFMGLGACTIHGVSYPVCTADANLNNRRVLYLENPQEAQYISSLDVFDDLSTQSYRGLKLSMQRRSAGGVSLNGNYTLSRCFGLDWANTGGTGGGYTNPADPDYDRGHCEQDRTHIANFTVGYQTPELESPLLRALASNWRVSGILNTRSGSWLTVTTGRNSFNGLGETGHRVNQVSDDVYGEKTLTRFLDRAAFAEPAPGTFGDHERNSIRGPGFWKVDMALSRLFALTTTQNVEVRVEAFNLLNTFNWGNPNVNFSSGNFGRIQSQAGDPRIMQFGIKYGF
jgi:hypothetical protein